MPRRSVWYDACIVPIRMRALVCSLCLLGAFAASGCSSSEEVLCSRMQDCANLRDPEPCTSSYRKLVERQEIPSLSLEVCAECVDEAACHEVTTTCNEACSGVVRFPRGGAR